VTSKNTTWSTSIFPDRKSGTYILPLKRQVREQLKITDGSRVKLTMRVIAD
jgi:hypothetical protein